MPRFLHVTTVHPRDDSRIRSKEIESLVSRFPGEVGLVVADGLGDSTDDGVAIHDIGGTPGGRLRRMFAAPFRAWLAVRQLRPKVVHFHDPELIPLGFLLRLSGYRIVYDVHEDLPRQVLDKHWLPTLVRNPVSWAMSALEWCAGRVFSLMVAATPTIAARFPRDRTITVRNYPRLEEFRPGTRPQADRSPHFIYTGVLAEIRGAHEMVAAIARVKDQTVRLRIAGTFSPRELAASLAASPGWSCVDHLGWLGRAGVAEQLREVRAGLVVLHPTRSYLDSLPIKMFEYMAAGLPVIASDFPLWRSIIDRAGCGLLVDPRDPGAIAEAMRWILDHPGRADEMGRRGRDAAVAEYNWSRECEALLERYSELDR